MGTAMRTVALTIEPITTEAFAPFGTLMLPSGDGKRFGADEAQLVLDRGTPRFYVLELAYRGFAFTKITRHMKVTQCLAAVGGEPWVVAVAPPLAPDEPEARPSIESIRAFAVPGNAAIMLHRSAWHAGPFFAPEKLAFFNLELADTNQVDHHTCDLGATYGVQMDLRDLRR